VRTPAFTRRARTERGCCGPCLAFNTGVVAFKLYPAGATTNSDSGVTDFNKCLPTLKAMAEVRVGFFLFFLVELAWSYGEWHRLGNQ
jgi:hypothetical protein